MSTKFWTKWRALPVPTAMWRDVSKVKAIRVVVACGSRAMICLARSQSPISVALYSGRYSCHSCSSTLWLWRAGGGWPTVVLLQLGPHISGGGPLIVKQRVPCGCGGLVGVGPPLFFSNLAHTSLAVTKWATVLSVGSSSDPRIQPMTTRSVLHATLLSADGGFMASMKRVKSWASMRQSNCRLQDR
ncbi:plant neutral invertase family protein [Striga asiatica]|uniref:Plant neutral invertase family protein n=1 Tax=Striga asiatica TaxID=4170 RepID=A0A5A7QGD5_STRAF|nr:plant neutral invertase family protein [Striga asiatica]